MDQIGVGIRDTISKLYLLMRLNMALEAQSSKTHLFLLEPNHPIINNKDFLSKSDFGLSSLHILTILSPLGPFLMIG
jgi:hypothetical protein